jgi:hypothetical protein
MNLLIGLWWQMTNNRIQASDLQWKGYTYIDEGLESCGDVADLGNEYGTRLSDGTVSGDDLDYDADDANYHFQIKKIGKRREDSDKQADC